MVMGEKPGDFKTGSGPVERALATSAMGNSPAFGFSIMITASFGVLATELGIPQVADLFAFAVAAALAVGMIEGVVSRGFRRRVDATTPEVAMLGTALNVVSVAVGIAAALLISQISDGPLGWGLAAFVASALYVLVESGGILIAEYVQAARGDRDAKD